MKKVNLFLILSLMVASFSCTNTEDAIDPSGEKAEVSIKVTGISKSLTKAPGIEGPEITDAILLDSLVKNARVIAFDNETSKCVAYADFNDIRLSKNNIVKMTVPVGVKDFIIVTNVNKLMDSDLIGKSREAMITKLSQDQFYNPDVRFRIQAPHMFYSLIEDKTIVAGQVNNYSASLVRLVAQLETMIDKTKVEGLSGSMFGEYIVSLDTIIVRNVSPDMSLTRIMNNQSPTLDASNTHIASTVWRAPGFMGNTNLKMTNFLLSFPTEPIGSYPYVIIGATVDPTKAPGEFSSEGQEPDVNGYYKRYWAVQLESNHLRENVRLLLDITKLKGTGSTVHPKPQTTTATCEFVIKLLDWDPVPDTEEGQGQQ